MNILTFFFFLFTRRRRRERIREHGEKEREDKKEHREGRRPASRRVGRNKYIAKKNPYFFVEKK
jgi:hypothetical protein